MLVIGEFFLLVHEEGEGEKEEEKEEEGEEEEEILLHRSRFVAKNIIHFSKRSSI